MLLVLSIFLFYFYFTSEDYWIFFTFTYIRHHRSITIEPFVLFYLSKHKKKTIFKKIQEPWLCKVIYSNIFEWRFIIFYNHYIIKIKVCHVTNDIFWFFYLLSSDIRCRNYYFINKIKKFNDENKKNRVWFYFRTSMCFFLHRASTKKISF